MIQSLFEIAKFNSSKCFFQATDQVTSKIEIAIIMFVMILGVITVIFMGKQIQYFKKTIGTKYSYKSFLSNFQIKVYGFLLLWVIATMSKCIVNIYAYFTYMKDESQDHIVYQQLLPLSAYFYLADNFCTYFLLTLMIIIPYHWLKEMMRKMNNDETQRNLSIQDRSRIKTIFKVLKGIKYYIRLRWLYSASILTMYFMILFGTLNSLLSTLWIYLVLVDSIIFILFYFFGCFTAIFVRRNNLLKMKPQQQRDLKIQYISLIFCLMIRCLMNGFFYLITKFYHYNPNQNCTDRQYQNVIKRSVFLAVGETIMHFLPVVIILYIYRPPTTKNSLKATLNGNQLINDTKIQVDDENQEIRKQLI